MVPVVKRQENWSLAQDTSSVCEQAELSKGWQARPYFERQLLQDLPKWLLPEHHYTCEGKRPTNWKRSNFDLGRFAIQENRVLRVQEPVWNLCHPGRQMPLVQWVEEPDVRIQAQMLPGMPSHDCSRHGIAEVQGLRSQL
jgi:hypothetical protein